MSSSSPGSPGSPLKHASSRPFVDKGRAPEDLTAESQSEPPRSGFLGGSPSGSPGALPSSAGGSSQAEAGFGAEHGASPQLQARMAKLHRFQSGEDGDADGLSPSASSASDWNLYLLGLNAKAAPA